MSHSDGTQVTRWLHWQISQYCNRFIPRSHFSNAKFETLKTRFFWQWWPITSLSLWSRKPLAWWQSTVQLPHETSVLKSRGIILLCSCYGLSVVHHYRNTWNIRCCFSEQNTKSTSNETPHWSKRDLICSFDKLSLPQKKVKGILPYCTREEDKICFLN